jgi:mono/diheme cytochrome c family protein
MEYSGNRPKSGEPKSQPATPLFLGLFCLAVLGASGCGRSGAGAASRNPIAVQHGKNVYDEQCAQCHEATDLHLIKDPPRMDGLFHKPTLPSGAPATDEEVRNVILQGRGIMPNFELTVGGDDLDALIQYLHTR